MSMLSKVFVFSLSIGLSCVLGAVNMNSESSNYFVLNFNDNEFPAATDRCVPVNILGTGYQKATCVDATTVTYQQFSDSDCTLTSGDAVTFNGSTQTGEGTYFDFACDGTNAYASIEFGTACDSNTKVIMDAAVSVCALTTDLGQDNEGAISINVYCQSLPNYAELQYYDTPNAQAAACEEADLYETATSTDECGFILETSGISVFGETKGCTASAVGSDDDSANTLNVICAFIMATILAIFAM